MFKLISAAAAALLMLTLVVGIAATVEDFNSHTHPSDGLGAMGVTPPGCVSLDRRVYHNHTWDGVPRMRHPHCPATTTDPGDTDPGDSGSTDPSPTAPSSTAPSSTAPGSTAPGSTAPGSTAPGSTAPGSTAPGSSTQPTPTPTPNPVIGQTGAATAIERAGDLLVLQLHDQPGVEIEVAIGWISRDGQTIIAVGFVRDGDLGQTYTVVRRESDGQVVRLWIAPDSPLVYAVPWPEVLAQYTFPVGVILTIPLDEQYPWPGQLARRFDGGDDRIFSYDAELAQWRHVPGLPTFQALGFYWCDVTAADAEFFTRITIGAPHPATTMPAQPDYPVCRT